MTNIDLRLNSGFKWFLSGNCRAKGYLFDQKNNFYEKEALAGYFATVKNEQSFISKLTGTSGLFSVIIEMENELFFAVDIVRMFPLFFFREHDDFWIGDDPIYSPEEKSIDPVNKNEFLSTGYVTGDRTLLNCTKQLKAGEAGILQNGILTIKPYTDYLPTDIRKYSSVSAAKKDLRNLLQDVFDKYLQAFQHHHLVLPLSGGFDSRLIACMLKRYGFKNVTCITYGRQGNNDAITSEKVAKKLGYPWIYIKYDDALIKNYIHDITFKAYVNYSAKYASQFFMQEYFAVKHLREHHLIPESAVFIPGHSGDFLAGSHLSGRIADWASPKKIASEILNRNFVLNNVYKKYRRLFFNEIVDFTSQKNAPAFAKVENWDWQERQAKYIVNSCNVYNYFDYRHCFPFWDFALFNFFKNLPFELKFNKKLYDAVVFDIFKEFDVSFDSDKAMNQPPAWKTSIKQSVKSMLPASFLYFLHKNRKDPHYYGPIIQYMVSDMKNSGYKVNENVRYRNAIIAQWYIYKLTRQRENGLLAPII